MAKMLAKQKRVSGCARADICMLPMISLLERVLQPANLWHGDDARLSEIPRYLAVKFRQWGLEHGSWLMGIS